ncbi:hypothetical protein ON010_g16424 [Phytophthora cinnamomi]|nr:hypothetical protein ON010_g16424 [Phytophthora cinnamomi]
MSMLITVQTSGGVLVVEADVHALIVEALALGRFTAFRGVVLAVQASRAHDVAGSAVHRVRRHAAQVVDALVARVAPVLEQCDGGVVALGVVAGGSTLADGAVAVLPHAVAPLGQALSAGAGLIGQSRELHHRSAYVHALVERAKVPVGASVLEEAGGEVEALVLVGGATALHSVVLAELAGRADDGAGSAIDVPCLTGGPAEAVQAREAQGAAVLEHRRSGVIALGAARISSSTLADGAVAVLSGLQTAWTARAGGGGGYRVKKAGNDERGELHLGRLGNASPHERENQGDYA